MRKARTQDVLYFFSGLAANWKARRPLAAFFERNYDAIYKRFESTYTTKYLVSIAYSVFSTAEDRAHVEAFFEGKDISKYNMSLAQAVDTIKAKTSWIERSTPDIVQWLEKRA
ncbi:hypothetical protein OF83DRAFT_1179110 [Amylostereum chailletii]|nr:hypothetical protein OF83DRAFT_1179110 [Amylostereum chailletii]